MFSEFDSLGLYLSQGLFAQGLHHGVLCGEAGGGVQILHRHHGHHRTPDPELDISSNWHQTTVFGGDLLAGKILGL